MTTPKTTPNDEQNHTIITSADELLRRYAAGERDFRGADLTEATLTEATLRGADLTEATLRGADLTEATLTGADLYRADLTGADLTEADLTEATLTGAGLYRADLREADLNRADLRGADLYRADLYRADLRGADLYRADLRGADLRGADLRGAKNPPSSSHDFLAEILRQAASTDYERRSVAGLVLISPNWCWEDFGRVSQAHWSPEVRAWIAATLAPWPALVTLAQRYGVIERDAHATDEKATNNATNEEA